MISLVRRDLGGDPAVDDAQSTHAQTLAADTNAPVAENAARGIKIHDGRPLLLFYVVLDLRETALAGSVPECHVLKLALPAFVAHRAIERMIRQQELEHRLPGLN